MNRQIDRYELLEQVGTGGMAAVYRGRDTVLDREVAIKILHPHLGARAESRARFSREARAVARLSHPNIVEIYDYGGETAEEGWIVTEFVRGSTLRDFAEAVGFGCPEIGMLIGRALADALAHAHSAGVIHRDLKPENVLVCQEPGKQAVKLADFGIARILSSDERMTMTGALVGSPNHMAPEIIAGHEADTRSDVFSLGTILYWMATGQMPFAAPNPSATLRRVMEGDHQDPRNENPLISDPLAAVIQRTLAVDPSLRFATASDVRDALDRVLSEAGLSTANAELEAFLADPAGYQQSFPARLVEALVEKGEEALDHGATARALGLFSRALAYQPGNPRVLGHLQRLEQRARTRRVARTAAVLLASTALVTLGWWLLPREKNPLFVAAPTEQASPSPVPPPAPTPAPAQPSSPPPAIAVASPAHSPTTPTPTAKRAIEAAVPTPAQLSVHVRPYAQRALLDGVEIAHGVQRVTFTLAPGRKHLIQIEHPCCRPFSRRIDSVEASRSSELRVPLEPKPALLRVEGNPATRVYAGQRLLGTAGDSQRTPFAIPVPPGDNPYEGQLEVQLELPGRGTVSVPIRVRAGSELVAAAPWEKAP